MHINLALGRSPYDGARVAANIKVDIQNVI